MTKDIIEAVVAIILIVRGVMSHREHRKTGKDVSEIKVYFNGELQKKIEQAREEGRQEERDKNKKTKL